MADIQLLLGLPHSGKTTRCLSAYAQALAAGRGTTAAGKTLWLTPAREARHFVLERLLPLTGGVVFQPNVQTFDQFAERVLLESGQSGRFVSLMARRLILRSVIEEMATSRRLAHFAQIVGTEGFLDVVSNFVSELKRAEIWPMDFVSACRQRSGTMTPRDTELHLIYDRYQEILQKLSWYDAEGRFWQARTAMKERPSGFWRELSLVVVDGFSDFTATQQEMLEQLAQTSRQMLLTLPIEQPLRRRALFAKPDAMAQQLQKRMRRAGWLRRIVCSDQPAALPAGLRQIHANLFENPREGRPGGDASGCDLIAATGTASEKTAVALRIKRLLGENVSPREIVVGLRSASLTGQEWARALQDAGIPAWCEAPLPWSRSPYLKILFGVLQLELEDWPFERLQGVLTSSLFRPLLTEWNADDGPRRITKLLRRAKLHSRKEQVLKGIDRWRHRVLEHDPDGDAADLEFAWLVLKHVAETGQALAKSASLADWADRLARVTARLGLAPSSSDADRRDAKQLQRLLRAAASIEQELADPPRQRTLEELLVILRDLVHSEPPEGQNEQTGCVRILGADTLRHLQPQFVFLVESTEDMFPSRRAEDCLFSEAERVRLHEQGLSLGHRELHQREEMLLFYQAVTRATSHLTLSYSQVNGSGHEVYPSPYVTALEHLFDPAARLSSPPFGSLNPVPDRDHILTPADLRLAAVSEARQKRPGWWRRLLENPSSSATARNVLAAADVAGQRFHAHGFTPFEGRLINPVHHARLANAFGSDRQFSATELEAYAACPFRFWMSSVLELDPLPSPEEATDFAGRGSLVHHVLAQLAQENLAEAPVISQRFRELVEERLNRQLSASDLQRALLEVERQLLDRWATAYGGQHGDYHAQAAELQLKGLRTLTEVPFGAARHAEESAPQQRFPALELRSADTVIRLGGRIDRVDVAESQGQTVFTVIDYKTGSKPAFQWDDVATGHTLQLAIYTLAVARLQIAGPDSVPHEMGYWAVRQTGFAACGVTKSTPSLEAAVRDTLEHLLTTTISRLVSGIRSGVFVVENDDANCTGRCPYHTVCRVNQIRPVAGRLEKRRADLLSIPGDRQ